MHFYPETDAQNNISEMDVLFDYSGWAPWNEQFSAESLMPVVMDTLQSWYQGNEFFNVELENEEDIWVKLTAIGELPSDKKMINTFKQKSPIS